MKICKIVKAFNYVYRKKKGTSIVASQVPSTNGTLRKEIQKDREGDKNKDADETKGENQNTESPKEPAEKKKKTPKEDLDYTKSLPNLLDNTEKQEVFIDWLRVAKESAYRLDYVRKDILGGQGQFFLANARGTSRYNKRLFAQRHAFYKAHGENQYFRFTITLTLSPQNATGNIYLDFLTMRTFINGMVAKVNSNIAGKTMFSIEVGDNGLPHAHGIIFVPKTVSEHALGDKDAMQNALERLIKYANAVTGGSSSVIEPLKGDKWFFYMNKYLKMGIDKIACKHKDNSKLSTMEENFIKAWYVCGKAKIRQFTGGYNVEEENTQYGRPQEQKEQEVPLTSELVRINYRLQQAIKAEDFSTDILKDFIKWVQYEEPESLTAWALAPFENIANKEPTFSNGELNTFMLCKDVINDIKTKEMAETAVE